MNFATILSPHFHDPHYDVAEFVIPRRVAGDRIDFQPRLKIPEIVVVIERHAEHFPNAV